MRRHRNRQTRLRRGVEQPPVVADEGLESLQRKSRSEVYSVEASQAARLQVCGVAQDRLVDGEQRDSLQDLFRPTQRPIVAVCAAQRPQHPRERVRS